MRKYKLVKDKQVPTESSIAKKKDFGNVRANYDKMTSPLYRKPLYKDPKTFLALLVILLVTWLVIQASKQESEEHNKPTTEVSE